MALLEESPRPPAPRETGSRTGSDPAARPAAPAAGGTFRTDIEGLRGFALLLVLAFHASVPGFEGGFVGLDLFFVISGFLITGQLAAEIRKRGGIDLRAFYARRARRIFPMAGVVAIATVIAAYAVLPQLEVYRLSRDLVSSMLYAANWHFIGEGNDYLALTHGESAAQHYWSLAVEEQFYIIWPLLLAVAVMLTTGARRRGAHAGAPTAQAGSRPLVIVLVLVTAVSLALSVWISAASPGEAYMGTHTRAWEFGIGGLLAIAVPAAAQGLTRRRLADVLGVLAALMIVASLLAYDRETVYPGVAAMVPVLAGCLWVVAGPNSLSGAVMRWRWMRAIGRWSYSIYLWHWPLLVLTEARVGELTWQEQSGLMAFSVVIGALTFRVVERAIADSRLLKANLRAAASVGITALVAGLSASLAVGTLVIGAIGAPSSTADRATFELVFGGATARNAGNVAPAPLYAEADLPTPPNCIIDAGDQPTPGCVFGVAGGRRVVLVGDSHAHQWQSAFQILAEENGWELTVTAKAGCPIADIPAREGDTSRLSDPSCPSWRAATLDRIEDLDPDLIVFTSLGDYIPERDQFDQAWQRTLDRFRSTDARLVYLRDTPRASFDVPSCISESLKDWSACAFPAPQRYESVVAGIARGDIDDVTLVDLNGFLCDGDTCPAVRNGTLLYRDDAHLTDTVVRLLTPAVRSAFYAEGLL